jgi:hypothetical protein
LVRWGAQQSQLLASSELNGNGKRTAAASSGSVTPSTNGERRILLCCFVIFGRIAKRYLIVEFVVLSQRCDVGAVDGDRAKRDLVALRRADWHLRTMMTIVDNLVRFDVI